MMKKICMGLVLVAVVVGAGFALRAGTWKYPTEWTFHAAFGKVFNIAKRLPTALPLKLVRANQGEKTISFKSDWGTLDIPKDVVIYFHVSKGQTTVDVTGAPRTQAYRILKEIGDKLGQPLPEPPKKHRSQRDLDYEELE